MPRNRPESPVEPFSVADQGVIPRKITQKFSDVYVILVTLEVCLRPGYQKWNVLQGEGVKRKKQPSSKGGAKRRPPVGRSLLRPQTPPKTSFGSVFSGSEAVRAAEPRSVIRTLSSFPPSGDRPESRSSPGVPRKITQKFSDVYVILVTLEVCLRPGYQKWNVLQGEGVKRKKQPSSKGGAKRRPPVGRSLLRPQTPPKTSFGSVFSGSEAVRAAEPRSVIRTLSSFPPSGDRPESRSSPGDPSSRWSEVSPPPLGI